MVVTLHIRHHAMVRRKWELLFDFIEIGLAFHVWEKLALIGRHSLQQYCQMRHIAQEAFMIVGVEIIARLMQTFEAPTIQLASKGLVFALHEVFGHNVSNQKILVVNFPRPAMWLLRRYGSNKLAMATTDETQCTIIATKPSIHGLLQFRYDT